jgi:hypothetical protein
VVWKFRVLKISKPVGQTEVAQVYDWRYFQFAEAGKGHIGETPVILTRSGIRTIIRRAISKELDTYILQQREVLLPPAIVVGFSHLINPFRAPTGHWNIRVTILDPSGEHKLTTCHYSVFFSISLESEKKCD